MRRLRRSERWLGSVGLWRRQCPLPVVVARIVIFRLLDRPHWSKWRLGWHLRQRLEGLSSTSVWQDRWLCSRVQRRWLRHLGWRRLLRQTRIASSSIGEHEQRQSVLEELLVLVRGRLTHQGQTGRRGREQTGKSSLSTPKGMRPMSLIKGLSEREG